MNDKIIETEKSLKLDIKSNIDEKDKNNNEPNEIPIIPNDILTEIPQFTLEDNDFPKLGNFFFSCTPVV